MKTIFKILFYFTLMIALVNAQNTNTTDTNSTTDSNSTVNGNDTSDGNSTIELNEMEQFLAELQSPKFSNYDINNTYTATIVDQFDTQNGYLGPITTPTALKVKLPTLDIMKLHPNMASDTYSYFKIERIQYSPKLLGQHYDLIAMMRSLDAKTLELLAPINSFNKNANQTLVNSTKCCMWQANETFGHYNFSKIFYNTTKAIIVDRFEHNQYKHLEQQFTKFWRSSLYTFQISRDVFATQLAVTSTTNLIEMYIKFYVDSDETKKEYIKRNKVSDPYNMIVTDMSDSAILKWMVQAQEEQKGSKLLICQAVIGLALLMLSQ